MHADEATIRLIELLVALLGATALITVVARRLALPYTVVLVLFGIVVGEVSPIRFTIMPSLVLIVLLPGLIFEAAYQIHVDHFRPSLGPIALLAGPGVLVVAGCVAAVLHVAAGLPIGEAFVVGAMVSATDPVAVIASFKRLQSPRRLATLVEAESLFNDGTGIVMFTIAVSAVDSATDPVRAAATFVAVVIFSAAIGLATGVVVSRLLAHVDDHLVELTVSLVLAYGTYLVAEELQQSGVIATAVAGLVLGNYGRSIGMSGRTEEALDTVWEFIAFLLTAIIFVLVGMAITPASLGDAAASIAWAVAAILVGRAVMVYGVVGGLSRVMPRPGANVPAAWQHVIFWSGLRGAVSVALALSLPPDFPDRTVVQGITFGVVLFTLLVQATTAELVIRRAGLTDGGVSAEA